MTVQFRSSSSLSSGTRTNSTLTAPAGIQDGDWLELVLYIEANVTPTPPAGFVQIATGGLDTCGDASDESFDAFVWRKKASAESGNYTITHASAFSAGYIQAISGGDAGATNGEDFAATSNAVRGDTSTTNYTATGATTNRDGSLVSIISASWHDYNPMTAPAGSTPTFTEQLDAAGIAIYVANGVMTSAGATGDKTATGVSQAQAAHGGNEGGVVAFLTSVRAPAASVGTHRPGVLPAALAMDFADGVDEGRFDELDIRNWWG